MKSIQSLFAQGSDQKQFDASMANLKRQVQKFGLDLTNIGIWFRLIRTLSSPIMAVNCPSTKPPIAYVDFLLQLTINLLHLRLFRHLQRVIDLYSKIAYCAF